MVFTSPQDVHNVSIHNPQLNIIKYIKKGKMRIKNDGDDDVGSQKQEEAHFRNGSFRWIAPQ
jgi:hypothetical protein